MEIELTNLLQLGQPAVWGLIIIVVLSVVVTVVSLFSMKKTGRIWRQVAVGSIELLLLACALYIYAFFTWWLAMGPLIPFIIILWFYLLTGDSRT